MSAGPRILVIDGYIRAAREELVAGGASMAGDLYSAMLQKILSEARCDIVYPSDPGTRLPSGAAEFNLASHPGIVLEHGQAAAGPGDAVIGGKLGPGGQAGGVVGGEDIVDLGAGREAPQHGGVEVAGQGAGWSWRHDYRHDQARCETRRCDRLRWYGHGDKP